MGLGGWGVGQVYAMPGRAILSAKGLGAQGIAMVVWRGNLKAAVTVACGLGKGVEKPQQITCTVLAS